MTNTDEEIAQIDSKVWRNFIRKTQGEHEEETDAN